MSPCVSCFVTSQKMAFAMPNRSLTDALEDDIIFGRFAPGARITEDRVMEQYDAKRHAVRNAFAALEARGLLIRKPNRGVEVVEFTPDEVDALYDVRIVLETAAAERTPLPAPDDVAVDASVDTVSVEISGSSSTIVP